MAAGWGCLSFQSNCWTDGFQLDSFCFDDAKRHMLVIGQSDIGYAFNDNGTTTWPWKFDFLGAKRCAINWHGGNSRGDFGVYNGNSGLAISFFSDGKFQILKSADGGSNWTVVRTI